MRTAHSHWSTRVLSIQRPSPGQERDDLRHRRTVLDEEQVAAFVQSQRGPGNLCGDRLAVGRWRDPVEAATSDERRRGDLREPLPHVVMAAGGELGQLAAPLL